MSTKKDQEIIEFLGKAQEKVKLLTDDISTAVEKNRSENDYAGKISLANRLQDGIELIDDDSLDWSDQEVRRAIDFFSDLGGLGDVIYTAQNSPFFQQFYDPASAPNGAGVWGQISGAIADQSDLIALLTAQQPAWGNVTGTLAAQVDLQQALNDRVLVSQKNLANGWVELDANIKIPLGYLPDAIVGTLSYQGPWNASTNSPLIQSGVGVNGQFYKVQAAGSVTIDGVSVWNVGDVLIYSGGTWHKFDNSDVVSSVGANGNPGQTGAVVITTDDFDDSANTNKFTSAAEKAIWDAKEDALTNTDLEIQTAVTHYGLTNNPHSVTKTQLSLGSVLNTLHKFDATTDPLVTDDSNANYSVGATWVNVTLDKTFTCVDASVGSAIWVQTSGGGSVLPSQGGNDSQFLQTDGAAASWQYALNLSTAYQLRASSGNVDNTLTAELVGQGVTGIGNITHASGEITWKLPASGMSDGALAGIVDAVGLNVGQVMTVDGNGKDIEGAGTLGFKYSPNPQAKIFRFSSDMDQWYRVSDTYEELRRFEILDSEADLVITGVTGTTATIQWADGTYVNGEESAAVTGSTAAIAASGVGTWYLNKSTGVIVASTTDGYASSALVKDNSNLVALAYFKAGRIWSNIPSIQTRIDKALGILPTPISGTTNLMAKFNVSGNNVEDSALTDDGTDLIYAGSNLTLQGATPAIIFGDGDTWIEETADDTLTLRLAASDRWIWTGNDFKGAATNAPLLTNAATGVTYTWKGDLNTGFQRIAANRLGLVAGGTILEWDGSVLIGPAGYDANISADQHVLVKKWVDDQSFLTAAGGTLTGDLDLDGNVLILDVDSDTTISATVDDIISYKIGGTVRWTMNGNNIIGNGTNAPQIINADTGVTYTWKGDLNTGFQRIAADRLGLVAGGTILEWDGSVLIGPAGYDANIASDQDVVVKKWVDDNTLSPAGTNIFTANVAFDGGYSLYSLTFQGMTDTFFALEENRWVEIGLEGDSNPGIDVMLLQLSRYAELTPQLDGWGAYLEFELGGLTTSSHDRISNRMTTVAAPVVTQWEILRTKAGASETILTIGETIQAIAGYDARITNDQDLVTKKWVEDNTVTFGSATGDPAFNNGAGLTAPAFNFFGDTDLGIGRKGTNNLGIYATTLTLDGTTSITSSDLQTIATSHASGLTITATNGLALNSSGANVTTDSDFVIAATKGVVFGDGDSKIYESADDVIRVHLATVDKWEFNADTFSMIVGSNGPLINATHYTFVGDTDTGILRVAANQLGLEANGAFLNWNGTVFTAPAGYDANIAGDQDFIVKKYFDDNKGWGKTGTTTLTGGTVIDGGGNNLQFNNMSSFSYFLTDEGNPPQFTLNNNPTDDAGIAPLFRLSRAHSTDGQLDNWGSSIEFWLEADDGATTAKNEIINRMTDVTAATYTTQWEFIRSKAGANETILTIGETIQAVAGYDSRIASDQDVVVKKYLDDNFLDKTGGATNQQIVTIGDVTFNISEGEPVGISYDFGANAANDLWTITEYNVKADTPADNYGISMKMLIESDVNDSFIEANINYRVTDVSDATVFSHWEFRGVNNSPAGTPSQWLKFDDNTFTMGGGVSEVTLRPGTAVNSSFVFQPLGTGKITIRDAAAGGDIDISHDGSNAIFDTNTGVIQFLKDVELVDVDVMLGTSIGTKFGISVNEKIGFYGANPVAQQAALPTALTTVTQAGAFTPDYAIQALTNTGPYGFATLDEAETVLSVILSMQARIGELETKLQNLGLVA